MTLRLVLSALAASTLLGCSGDGTAEDTGEAAVYPNETEVAWECSAEVDGYLPANDAFWPEGWVQYDNVGAPYEIRALTAVLASGAGLANGQACDPRVGLEIAVWVSDDEDPGDYANGASPMSVPDLGSAVLVGTTSPGADYATEEVTVQLDTPIEVLQGQRLFVGYRDNGATGTGPVGCLASCEGQSAALWQHDPDDAQGTYVYAFTNDTTVLKMGVTIATP